MEHRNDSIEIIGASENNLKHIDVTIPKGKLVVFAGVSGSGKTGEAGAESFSKRGFSWGT